MSKNCDEYKCYIVNKLLLITFKKLKFENRNGQNIIEQIFKKYYRGANIVLF